MAKWKTADFRCQHCGNHEIGILFDIDSEDIDVYNCSSCGELSTRVFGAPTVMNASLPDGARRNDGAWQNAKAVADLKCHHAEANHGSEERKQIEKEIKARSIPITKGGG